MYNKVMIQMHNKVMIHIYNKVMIQISTLIKFYTFLKAMNSGCTAPL